MKEQDLISSPRGAGKPAARISSKLQRTLCQGVAVAALAFAFAPNAAKAERCLGFTTSPPFFGTFGATDNGVQSALACGQNANASNPAALTPPGPNTTNPGTPQDVAIGPNASAVGAWTNGSYGISQYIATAVGGSAVANGAGTTAVGGTAKANTAWDTSVGANSFATGGGSIDFGATAVGSWAQSTNMGATALGQFAQAKPSNADIGSGTATNPQNYNPLIGAASGTLATKPISGNASLATAVGNWSIAAGYNSTAVGQLASTNADNATAVGQFAYATANNASGLGQGSWAAGTNSLALGAGAYAGSAVTLTPPGGPPNSNFNGNIPYTNGVGSAGDTAVGYFTTATGGSSTAIGGTDATYNQATGAYSGASAATVNNGATSGVAIGGGNSNGNGANVSQNSVGGVAIGGGSGGSQGATVGFNLLKYYNGQPATTTAPGAIAIGGADGTGSSGASAAYAGDVSIGTGSSAIGGGQPNNQGGGSCGQGVPGGCNGAATSVGYAATAWGQGTTAIGNYAYAIGGGSDPTKYGFDTAVGNLAFVDDVNNGTAVGQFSLVKGNNGTAVGQAAYATADNSSAFGQSSWASGEQSTALGVGAYAGSAAFNNPPMGGSTNGLGTMGDTAVGYYSTAVGGYSTAVGTGSYAGGQNSVAIGAGAYAPNANQVVLGAPGVLQASTASQVGPTNFVTSDKNGTLGTSQFGPGSIAALNASVANLYQGQAALQQQIYSNRRELRQGIAIAYVGGSTAPMPSAPGKVTWIMNSGVYKNEAAISGSLAYRLPTPIPVALVGGVSVGFNSSVAAKGGLQGEF